MEKETIDVLVVKAEKMRPLAGIWRDDENGRISAELYMKRHNVDDIVKATLTEK